MPINGSAIESLFDFEAMSKGLIVSAPRSDTAQYDRVIDNKKALYRIQIKARRGNGKKSIIVRVNKSKGQIYSREDTDVIALYIEDNDSWYFLPVEECKHVFRLNVIKDKKDKYKNNWAIFK